MAEQTTARSGRHTDTVRFTRRNLVALVIEVGLVAALLLLYREGRTLARSHVGRAEQNAAWLWHLERSLHLPNEGDLQHWLLTSSTLVHFADRYYVGVHFPITAAFLLWLWFRHHNRYGRVRTTLVITTALGLLLTVLVPLAPPRLFGGDGLVDTMQVFGPSAYNANTTVGLANQYAAMPSLHIAWSVLVGVTVVLVSTRRWRWVVLAHPVVTTFVVIATANHYWSDGLVAVVILGVSAAAVYRPQWFVDPVRRCVVVVVRRSARVLRRP
ncbi:MAG: phosphatase PAP2 family protein [Mycobacteriales bacterium]